MTLNRLALIAPLLALSLAGCSSVNAVTPSPTVSVPSITVPVSSNTSKTVKNVQSIAVTICGFLPIASTVINVLTNNPLVPTAEAIASKICSVATNVKVGGRRYSKSNSPTLDGVEIKGSFVR